MEGGLVGNDHHMYKWSYTDRMNVLQRKLGHPETGVYMKRDHRKLGRLPRILQDIIEEHYGTYATEGVAVPQAAIAKRMGLGQSNLSLSIKQAFELLEHIDSLEEELDQVRRDYRDKVPTNLDWRSRHGIRQAIYRLQDVLEKDGVVHSEEEEESTSR
jgi:hypothetical protein